MANGAEVRPGVVTACAVINFVYGFLGVTCLGLAAVGKMMSNAKTHTAIEDVAWFNIWQKISIPIGVLATIAIVAAGVGLLSRRPWARPVSLAWAYWNLFGLLLQIFVLFAYVLPSPEMFVPAEAPAFAATMVKVSQIVALVILGPYPIFLLSAMNRPDVKRWLDPQAAPPAPPTTLGPSAPTGGDFQG